MLTRADLLTDFSIQASLHASLYFNNAVGPNQHQPIFLLQRKKSVRKLSKCHALLIHPHRSVLSVLMKQLFRLKGVYTDYKTVAHAVNSTSVLQFIKNNILHVDFIYINRLLVQRCTHRDIPGFWRCAERKLMTNLCPEWWRLQHKRNKLGKTNWESKEKKQWAWYLWQLISSSGSRPSFCHSSYEIIKLEC